MNAPQIIMIVLIVISLVLEFILNGEETTTKHSFVEQFIAKALFVALLYWGGFWN